MCQPLGLPPPASPPASPPLSRREAPGGVQAQASSPRFPGLCVDPESCSFRSRTVCGMSQWRTVRGRGAGVARPGGSPSGHGEFP